MGQVDDDRGLAAAALCRSPVVPGDAQASPRLDLEQCPPRHWPFLGRELGRVAARSLTPALARDGGGLAQLTSRSPRQAQKSSSERAWWDGVG